MKRAQFFFLIIFYFFSNQVFAASSLPRHLSTKDQIRALEILGFGTAAKVLNNPYPLGGNLGFEIGVTSEFIPLDDLSNLGNKTRDTSALNYFTITMGKGLYNNFDIFLYFSPPVQVEDMQNFGLQARWGFYEASFFPISFAISAYAGGANFSNLINISTTGADLLATVAMDNMAFYFGTGRVHAKGNFIGATDIISGITSNTESSSQNVDEVHSLLGINVNIDKWFVAAELNRYSDSVYSTKIGYSF